MKTKKLIKLHYALQRLYADYAEKLDDGPLQEWPSLFCEQCLYQLTPRDNFERGLPLSIMRCESRGMLEDRVRAVQETVMHEPRYLRHHITNIRIGEINGNAIDVNANYSVIEVLHDELPRILSAGRYIDRVERQPDGELLFKAKQCVYDSVLVPNTIVYPI
jgi:3-phenylpropionate/cinnamic acid dioxygenase small subunit